MAASRDKQSRNGVTFTMSSAKEIATVVRQVLHGDRKSGGLSATRNAQASSHYLSKTTTAWTKGSSQTMTLYVGDPGSETATDETVDAWNKFADVQAGKWCMLARANGSFYLVAAEC